MVPKKKTDAASSSTVDESGNILVELLRKRQLIIDQQERLNGLIDQNSSQWNISDLESRVEILKGYFDGFSQVQDTIEALDDTEAVCRNKFEDSFCEIKSKMSVLIVERRLKCYSDESTQSAYANYGRSEMEMKTPLIPKVHLPKFSGKLNEWSEFFAVFNEIIHKNNSLSNIQKFVHLRACLSEHALLIIESLNISNENYDEAIRLLKIRFENRRLTVQSHINDVFALKCVDAPTSSHLRKLSDVVAAHIRALNNLIDKEKLLDMLLTSIIVKKCDRETQSRWEENLVGERIPTWDEFIVFINQRCQVLENIEHNIKKQNTSVNKFNIKKTSFSIAMMNQCSHCRSNKHFIDKCEAFLTLTPQERYTSAKNLQLGINCLRAGHIVKACRSHKCHHCGMKHNTLLHFPRENRACEASDPESNIPSVRSESVQKQLDKSDWTSSSNSEESSSKIHHTFLATAIVNIGSNTSQPFVCRALLDSASQLNFITERTAQALRFTKTRTQVIVNGIGETTTAVKNKVQVEIRSRSSKFVKTIEALVLSTIQVAQPHTPVEIESWQIPNHVTLADPNFHIFGDIDLLLGAGLFFLVMNA